LVYGSLKKLFFSGSRHQQPHMATALTVGYENYLGRYTDNGPGTRPTGLGPRRLKTMLDGPLIPQGLITGNAVINPSLNVQRRKDISQYDRDEVMGTDLGTNDEYLDIHPMDLLITPAVDITSTGYEGLIENRPPVMPAMNGLYIANREGLTEQRWQSRWRVIGPSAVAYTFGIDKESSGNSMTYYLRGSYSIYGRSTQHVNYGSLIACRVPTYDRLLREKEQEVLGSVASNANHPKERLEPILYKVEYEDYARLLHNAITESFLSKNENMRDLQNIIDNHRFEHQDSPARLALAMRLNALMAVFIGVCTLEDYGLIRINTPWKKGQDSLGAFHRQYHRFDQAEKLDANAVASQHVSVDDDGLMTIKQEQEVVEADHRRKYFGRMFVASKLGIFHDVQTRGLVTPAQNIVEAIVARHYRAFVNDPDIYESADPAFLVPERQQQATLPGANGLNTIYNTNIFLGQISFANLYASSSYAMAHVQAKRMFDDTVKFMAIARGNPGENWDVLQ
jgi:hypothetical protein